MAKQIININSLVALISAILICGKNSVYKSKDIAYRLIESAINNQSLEAMYKTSNFLSADRVLERLHCLDYKNVQNLIVDVNNNLKLPKSVKLAIDFTEYIYYGSRDHLGVLGSKGGEYVRRYFELSIVNPALFINAFPVDQFTNNKVKLIKQIIDGFYTSYKETKIEILLMDRAFFAKNVVDFLIDNNIPFLMPAVKNKAIQPLAEQFRKGWLPEKIKYQFGKYEINLLFIMVKGEVLVYATNTKKTPAGVFRTYRKRWQIETNFREQNNFLLKTQTTDFVMRYFVFALSGLLFNLWQLSRNNNTESYLFKMKLTEEIVLVWYVEILRKRHKIPVT
jgi:hypothetical protein